MFHSFDNIQFCFVTDIPHSSLTQQVIKCTHSADDENEQNTGFVKSLCLFTSIRCPIPKRMRKG